MGCTTSARVLKTQYGLEKKIVEVLRRHDLITAIETSNERELHHRMGPVLIKTRRSAQYYDIDVQEREKGDWATLGSFILSRGSLQQASLYGISADDTAQRISAALAAALDCRECFTE